MVKLTRIYTRTGDEGLTGLARGGRRAKHDLRIMTFGEVDEANAAIGMARCTLNDTANNDMTNLDSILARIQNDLFDLGADLATLRSLDEEPGQALRITAKQIDNIEADIDRLNGPLPPLNSFILPGGSSPAAAIHLARAIVRRAERALSKLAASCRDGGAETSEPAGADWVNPQALKYLNRLSDFLFVAARHANQLANREDVLWVPGGKR